MSSYPNSESKIGCSHETKKVHLASPSASQSNIDLSRCRWERRKARRALCPIPQMPNADIYQMIQASTQRPTGGSHRTRRPNDRIRAGRPPIAIAIAILDHRFALTRVCVWREQSLAGNRFVVHDAANARDDGGREAALLYAFEEGERRAAVAGSELCADHCLPCRGLYQREPKNQKGAEGRLQE